MGGVCICVFSSQSPKAVQIGDYTLKPIVKGHLQGQQHPNHRRKRLPSV